MECHYSLIIKSKGPLRKMTRDHQKLTGENLEKNVLYEFLW